LRFAAATDRKNFHRDWESVREIVLGPLKRRTTMKRILVLVTFLALGAGLAYVAVESSSEALAETAVQGVAPQAEDSVEAACTDIYDDAEALLASGFTFTEVAAGGVPDCPPIWGCGGYNVTCRSKSCSTSDTGSRHCRLPNGSVVQCTRNRTIHVTTCGCEELFRAACCTQDPACLCAGCNSSSRSVSCQ
jgi:hypothetical protein